MIGVHKIHKIHTIHRIHKIHNHGSHRSHKSQSVNKLILGNDFKVFSYYLIVQTIYYQKNQTMKQQFDYTILNTKVIHGQVDQN